MTLAYRVSFLTIWVALRRAIVGNGLRFTPFNRTQTCSQSPNQRRFQLIRWTVLCEDRRPGQLLHRHSRRTCCEPLRWQQASVVDCSEMTDCLCFLLSCSVSGLRQVSGWVGRSGRRPFWIGAQRRIVWSVCWVKLSLSMLLCGSTELVWICIPRLVLI